MRPIEASPFVPFLYNTEYTAREYTALSFFGDEVVARILVANLMRAKAGHFARSHSKGNHRNRARSSLAGSKISSTKSCNKECIISLFSS